MRSKRLERVSDVMIAEISRILLRKVKDPRVRYVTVTDVEISKDLKSATVFFSVFDDKLDKEDVLSGLNHAAGFIHKELFHALDIRTIPSLSFKIDPSIEYGAHIQKLLNTIQEGKKEDEKGEP